MNKLKTPKSVVEAGKVFTDALGGDMVARGVLKSVVQYGYSDHLQEAISSSDLNAAFTRSLKDKLIADYAAAPRVWNKVAKRNVMEDFKPEFFRGFNWDEGLQLETHAGIAIPSGSLARVPELTEYPTFKFSTSENSIQLYKHGARLPFSFEAVINDEWGFIQSIPGNMLRMALNTEETEAFGAFVGATGPKTSVFGTVETWTLSLDSLSAAKTAVRRRKVNGRSVNVPKFALVVSTGQADYARSLLNITSYEETVDGKTFTTSPSNGDVELVVADVLSTLVTDAGVDVDKMWFLVPLGGTDGVRDSVLLNFLRNNEAPDLRVSGAAGLYIAGGAVDPLQGSLLNDEISYRVRHVVAGGIHYKDAMWASMGTVAMP